MVDGVVEEQDFCRFYEETDEGEDAGLQEELNACRQEGQDDAHDRTDQSKPMMAMIMPGIPTEKFIDEQFQTRFDVAVDSLVNF